MTMPLQRGLVNLAAELDRVAGQARRIDEGFGSMLACGVPGSGTASVELVNGFQTIDLMRQSLDCLRDFVLAVAGTAPGEVEIDAAAAVTGLPLRDLARRLSDPAGSADGAALSPDTSATAGDASFF